MEVSVALNSWRKNTSSRGDSVWSSSTILRGDERKEVELFWRRIQDLGHHESEILDIVGPGQNVFRGWCLRSNFPLG